DHERDDEAAVVRNRGVKEARVDDAAEGGQRVTRRLHVAQNLALELAAAPGDGGEQQVFLVAKVVVERALRDPDLARDAVDGRSLVAVASEAGGRRGQH